MIYKKFKELQLSSLGLGLMRFPVFDKDDRKVDVKAAEKVIDYAYQHGVNYFDTAWGYHGGNSEPLVGEILSKYPRDTYYVATKFPGYDQSNFGKTEEIFEKQLQKCKTAYFDFYLFHNVCEANIDAYLNPTYRTLEYLLEQKKNGRIRHLGFSTHGTIPTMTRFLEAYGQHMEFCQLQLNYMDWHFQGCEEKVALLDRWNIPVWVMEPLRGGRLAKASETMEMKMKQMRPDETVPAWAFRFIQSIPQVTMVLSGMSNVEQLAENIAAFSEDKPLTAEERSAIVAQIDAESREAGIPCTACSYCTNYCPQGLEIPELLALYNEHKVTGGGFIAPMAVSSMAPEKRPANCIGCRSCEQVCPQQIKISEVLDEFSKRIKM